MFKRLLRYQIFCFLSWKLVLVTLSPDQQIKNLKYLIQRCPRWRFGRLILCRKALDTKNTLLGYSEACAALELSKLPKERAEALLLLATTEIRLSDFKGAINRLQQVLEHLSFDKKLVAYEELAAAHMALGDNRAALEQLLKIPVSERSREVLSAIKFNQGYEQPK